jgi:DNA-binding YbaB/EbfC family protein
MGSGFSKFKKQAKALTAQYEKVQEEMEQFKAIGSAGNGLVTLTLSGKYEMQDLAIKPDCVNPSDVEGLQDLIRSAYHEALQKIEAYKSEKNPQQLTW